MKLPVPKSRTSRIIVLVAVVGVIAVVTILNGGSPNHELVGVPSSTKGLPPGEITPSDLDRNHDSYANKQVKLRGVIVKNGSSYIITDASSSAPKSFLLDISKLSGGMNKYFPTSGDTSRSNPVTITATFKLTAHQDGGSSVSLIVKSIAK